VSDNQIESGGILANEFRPLKRLTAEEVQKLLGQFRHSRPFCNLVERLKRLANPAPLVWYSQNNYRVWHGDDLVFFGGAPVMRTHTKSNRVFIGVENLAGDLDLLASIVLNYRHRADKFRVPMNVGRTLLPSPERLVGEKAQLLRAPCSFLFPNAAAGVGGLVEVMTFPFAQQDSDHHRCIDVTIWCGLDYLSRHMGTPRVPIGLLRNSQLKQRNHLVPAVGLLPEEVIDCIALAGVAPVHYEPTPPGSHSNQIGWPDSPANTRGARRIDPALMSEVIVAYLKSQLPVFLVIRRHERERDEAGHTVGLNKTQPFQYHSLCAVGFVPFSADEGSEVIAECRKEHAAILGGSTVRSLVVHDDDMGPFLQLPIRSRHRIDSPGDLSSIWFESLEDNLSGMFVGLPPTVRMAAEDAINLARGHIQKPWIDLYIETLGAASPDGYIAAFLAAIRSETMRIDVFLEHSSRLRTRAISDGALSTVSQQLFLDLTMPQFVWVAEFSVGDDASNVLGEIVIDPSLGFHRWSVFSCRFPGVHWFRHKGKWHYLGGGSGGRGSWHVANFRTAADDIS